MYMNFQLNTSLTPINVGHIISPVSYPNPKKKHYILTIASSEFGLSENTVPEAFDYVMWKVNT